MTRPGAEPRGAAERSPARFSAIAGWFADAMGTPAAFLVSTAGVLVWAALGPAFGYSDFWLLIVTTITTVLTFLAVFLIQHAQNKGIRAIQLKLDELIRAQDHARDRLMNLQFCSEEELDELEQEFRRRRQKAVESNSEAGE